MDKVVLITGVSSGFGKAIASELLKKSGYVVYGVSRKPLDFSINGLRFRRMDVTQKDSVSSVISSILAEVGKIDVLINNAGIGIFGATELATQEEIELQMNTNFLGVVNLCSEVIPCFRSRGGGTILNISSIAGVFAVPYQGFYSASKSAMEAYSEALSLETYRFGVRVIVVEPGDFNTGFTKNRLVSRISLENSDYRDSVGRVIKKVEKDEALGGSPEYLAKKIAKIIDKKQPKFRYVITPNIAQKVSVVVDKLLTNRVFQRILRFVYSV